MTKTTPINDVTDTNESEDVALLQRKNSEKSISVPQTALGSQERNIVTVGGIDASKGSLLASPSLCECSRTSISQQQYFDDIRQTNSLSSMNRDDPGTTFKNVKKSVKSNLRSSGSDVPKSSASLAIQILESFEIFQYKKLATKQDNKQYCFKVLKNNDA